ASFVLFLFHLYAAPPALRSFPTRRSSDLPRSALNSSSFARIMLNARDRGSRLSNPKMPRSLARSGVQSSIFASAGPGRATAGRRSEEHTSELQSRGHLVCRLLLEKKKKTK